MRYLLRFSFAFVLVSVLLVLVGFLLPGAYRVSRAVEIAAAPEEVFPLVGDLARWRDWSPWFARDPQMELRFAPATAGVGAWVEWRGAHQGGGRAEVLGTRSPEHIRYRMTFADVPVGTEGVFDLVATAGGRGAHVTWTSEARLGWSPLARWFGLLLRRAEAAELERGLGALKTCAEKHGAR